MTFVRLVVRLPWLGQWSWSCGMGGLCVTRSVLTVVSGRSSVTIAMAVATSVTNLSDHQPAIIATARASNARTLGAAQTVAEEVN